MMRASALLCLLATLSLACSPQARVVREEITVVEEEVTPEPSPEVLTLAPLKLVADDTVVVELMASGQVAAGPGLARDSGEPLGTLTPDGVMAFDAKNLLKLRLAPDTKVHLSMDGVEEDFGARVDDEGDLLDPSGKVTARIAEDGTIDDGQSRVVLRVEGVTQENRRLAMVLYLIFKVQGMAQ